RFIRYFKNAAASAIRSPEKKISEIEIMSEDEKKQVMFDFNDSQADYPSQKSIHGLFEEQAANTPGNVAVYHEDRQVTYSTLNAKANHLARLLRQQGITGDDTVGILEEYSIGIVVGLLGVLKAGSTYVPIDIQYPDTRKKFIIEDSGAKVLLIHKNFYEQYKFMSRRFPVNNFVCLDNESDDGEEYSNPEIINRPHDLAYVIYTSGTTGKPKGVMIEHQGVVNYIFWAISCYVRNEAVNFPLYTSISFDLTVTSIFTPLLSGNAVVVYSGNDKFLVEKIIDENRVDVMKLTPSHLNLVKEMKKPEIPSRIKRLILGGEELPTQLALDIYRSFKGNIRIYNEYGPTETVVGCMIYQFNPGEISGRSVSIGVPINNMWIYILDSRQNSLPICVPGEICISGAGVARGYLKQEKLTAEKFLENPFVKGKRLYRSGDLGKWRSDGNVEFLGRLDQQVKIRGFRIEPGEIETQLMNHPQVKNVVVTAKKEANSEKDLCAYIVSDRHLNVLEIREFLSGTLPDYMIPAYFYQVEDIPLTANGKVDGKKLATYESNLDPGIEYIAPTTDMEKRIAEIWKDILKLDKVGLMDNFFQIGGNSLKVILLFRRLKERLNLDFSVVLLFDHPTIGSFIKYLSENDQQESTIIGKDIERANEIDRAKQRKRKQIAKRKKGAANG
ncbi:MAG: non-ribosomal peptide synthetase, partial [Candidatus Aminicenantes bacterium]